MPKNGKIDEPSEDKSLFEDSIKKLELIVEGMECGDIPLHELVNNYQHGMKLVTKCRLNLEEAELRIEKVSSAQTNSSDQSDQE